MTTQRLDYTNTKKKKISRLNFGVYFRKLPQDVLQYLLQFLDSTELIHNIAILNKSFAIFSHNPLCFYAWYTNSFYLKTKYCTNIRKLHCNYKIGGNSRILDVQQMRKLEEVKFFGTHQLHSRHMAILKNKNLQIIRIANCSIANINEWRTMVKNLISVEALRIITFANCSLSQYSNNNSTNMDFFGILCNFIFRNNMLKDKNFSNIEMIGFEKDTGIIGLQENISINISNTHIRKCLPKLRALAINNDSDKIINTIGCKILNALANNIISF